MGRPVGKFLYELAGDEEIHLLFWCPGCKRAHPFIIQSTDPDRPQWTWNEDPDRPTFSPSLLVNKLDAASRCHLFLRDGQLQFLQDCHHDLRGQTIALPDYRDHE